MFGFSFLVGGCVLFVFVFFPDVFVLSFCDFLSFALTKIAEFGIFVKIPNALVPRYF